MENANTRHEFVANIDEANGIIARMEVERGIPQGGPIEQIDVANDRIEKLAATPVREAASPGVAPVGTPRPSKPEAANGMPAPEAPAHGTQVWHPVGLGRAIIAASGGKTPSTRPPEPPQTTKLTGLARAIAAAEKQAQQSGRTNL